MHHAVVSGASGVSGGRVVVQQILDFLHFVLLKKECSVLASVLVLVVMIMNVNACPCCCFPSYRTYHTVPSLTTKTPKSTDPLPSSVISIPCAKCVVDCCSWEASQGNPIFNGCGMCLQVGM